MKWQMASRTAALSSTTRIQGVGMVGETTRINYSRQYDFSLIFVALTVQVEFAKNYISN
jgi:hypothetical protein